MAMSEKTANYVIYEFGYGIHNMIQTQPNATQEVRMNGGYNNLASCVQARLECLLADETIDPIDRDLLAAVFNRMKDHEWKMVAIDLINDKERD